MKSACLLTAALTALVPGLAVASAKGDSTLELRTRYENAQQDNGLKDANALTTRLRLGHSISMGHGWTAMVEYEGVYASAGQRYLSAPGTLAASNGNTAYSLIPDPNGDEINRAALHWAGPGLQVTMGRQRIIHDNARFVGNVGWRQDEQTFDGLRVQGEPGGGVTLDYSYLYRQNFIFFNANDMSTHLLNAHWQAHNSLALSAFAYLLDFDINSGAAPRVPGAADSRTLGLLARGKLGALGYSASYAQQTEYADSPAGTDPERLAVELQVKLPRLKLTGGFERLGGDGRNSFQTPFGTNHKFQGFADIFVAATPAFGIEDGYLGASTQLAGINLAISWHDFSADHGSSELGTELDLSVGAKLSQGIALLAKFADYHADAFSVDTRRVWLQAAYEF